MEQASTTRSAKELIVTRLLNAPRALVFETWTDPRHLAHWWGPDGFTLTTKKMEVIAGGTWEFIMHGPDGTDFLNRIVFIEVLRPEKLVYKQSGEGETKDVQFHVTVSFQEEGEKTRLTLHSVFDSAEILDRVVRDYGAIEGGKQTLNRLATYLIGIQGKIN